MTYSPKRIFLSRICCKTTCFNNMRNNLAIYKCFVYSWPMMDNSSTNSVEQFATKFMTTTIAQLHVAWIVLFVGIINYQNILTHKVHDHYTRNYWTNEWTIREREESKMAWLPQRAAFLDGTSSLLLEKSLSQISLEHFQKIKTCKTSKVSHMHQQIQCNNSICRLHAWASHKTSSLSIQNKPETN